jgi:hypothetical protein
MFPSMVLLVGMLFMPETPRYLCIQARRKRRTPSWKTYPAMKSLMSESRRSKRLTSRMGGTPGSRR